MYNTNPQSDDNSKIASFKRIEVLFAQFAEKVGGIYSVKAGQDEDDAIGLQSDFTNWIVSHVMEPLNDKTANPTRLSETEFVKAAQECVYVKYKFQNWNIEFHAVLNKFQSLETVKVYVKCAVLQRRKLFLEVVKMPNPPQILGKNRPFSIPKWLGVFLPHRYVRSRTTYFSEVYNLSFQDAVLQNSFLARCNDQGLGQRLIQDSRFHESLKNSPRFETLELGLSEWAGTTLCKVFEIRTSTAASFGIQPLEEALQLAKTCLTLLEEFGVITENTDE